jgi:hypothetical protein
MTWTVGGAPITATQSSLVSTKTFAIRRREKDWSRESRPASWAATCCNRRRTASDSRTQLSRFWLAMAGCLSHFYCGLRKSPRIACRLTRSSKAFVRSACMTIRSGPSIRVGFQTKTSFWHKQFPVPLNWAGLAIQDSLRRKRGGGGGAGGSSYVKPNAKDVRSMRRHSTTGNGEVTITRR